MPPIVILSPELRAAAVNGNKIVDDCLGIRFLSGPTEVIRDEASDCELELMHHPRISYDAVHEGATFTVREGAKVVGFGVVTDRSESE